MKAAFNKLEPTRISKRIKPPADELSGLDEAGYEVFMAESGLQLDGAVEIPEDVLYSDDEDEVASPSTSAGEALQKQNKFELEKTMRMLWTS